MDKFSFRIVWQNIIPLSLEIDKSTKRDYRVTVYGWTYLLTLIIDKPCFKKVRIIVIYQRFSWWYATQGLQDYKYQRITKINKQMRSVYKYLGAGIGHLNKILCQTCHLDKKKDLFAISAE